MLDALSGIPDPAAALEKVREALITCSMLDSQCCVICGWNYERGHAPICEIGNALSAITPQKDNAHE